MRDFFEKAGALIPHITMISSMMIMVFFTIDRLNKYMGFMTHKYTTIVIMVLAVTSFIGSVMLIGYQRREVKRFNRRTDMRKGKDSDEV